MPGLTINSTPQPSGQRVVYFCKFEGIDAPPQMIEWGEIVLKVTEELSSRQVAYLQREIEILNSLNSPHYPKLCFNEVFTHEPNSDNKLEKRLFVTIEERINAEPLSKKMGEYKDINSVVDFLEKMINALHLLWTHEKKIVHRDIKPDNILVKENNDLVIIDLGIVREEGGIGLTEEFQPWGPCSPPYASPEQAKNDKKNISFKSDCFSLGTLAYELLTGENPFCKSENKTRADVFDRVVNLDLKSLYDMGLAPKMFSDMINKMMSKEPFQRHRTIESLKTNLRAIKESIRK